MSNSLWQEASAFSARTHLHQERNDGTPYASHPARVAMTIAEKGILISSLFVVCIKFEALIFA